MADDGLLEAVRGLHLAHPQLGPKPLLAKLREQQPDLAAGSLFFEPFADRRFFIFSLSRHSQIGLVFTTLRSYNDV
jgi:hypothetical protein